MSKRTEEDFLNDILDAMQKIASYTLDMTYEDFLEDTKTQDAVIRNIEIIGEAAKNISDRGKDKNTTIPWKPIAGMRDRLIHGYFGVNIDIVWGVVSGDLPQLENQIRQMMKAVL
jgi:uncharacterized protein with HEPN domain